MIIFRADLSPLTGLQHVRRSSYLVSLLKKSDQALICCREEKKTAKFLAERNIPTRFVKDLSGVDLAEVKAVIFDLPNFSAADSSLLENARKTGIKTVQIISNGCEDQPADMILQPLAERDVLTATPGPIIISGPAYALLHHKFRHFSQVGRKYPKNIKNIFINLGDLLPYRSLRQIVDCLHRLHFKMKIAPGLNLKKADKRNLLKIYPGIHFCGKSESLARAYFEADLALIPAGEEILEAAAAGTPALYFCQEPVQEAIAVAWANNQAGLKFGKLEDLNSDSFRDITAPLSRERCAAMGAAGKKLVDGLGVQRFFKVLKDNGIIA